MTDSTLIVVNGDRRATLEQWTRDTNRKPNRMLETEDSVAAVYSGDKMDGIVARMPQLLSDNMVGAVLVFGEEGSHGAVYQGERLAEREAIAADTPEELVDRLTRFTTFILPTDSWEA